MIELKSPENVNGEVLNDKAHIDKKVEYRADSVKFNKSKSIIYMFGNVEVTYDDVKISANKAIYDSKNSLLKASNSTIYPNNQKKIKADSIYYDVKTSKAKLFGADLNR